jgi:hypothetical protein
LNSIFTKIIKEEIQQRIDHDFTTLKTMMEEEKALQIEVMRRLIGRPSKPVEVVMLTPKVEEQPFKI